MNWQSQCATVIPCLNEAAAIAALVTAARPHTAAVLVVDDGSTDDTAARATAAGAQVLTHPQNLGKGAALRTGLAAARAHGYDWAFTLDGDGQHAPADMPAFYAQAEQTAAALIIGNRMADTAQMSRVRCFANRWASRRISRLAGLEVGDSQCGFRLLDLRLWSGLALIARRFEVESEMLLAFARAGHRVEFVPIRAVPSPRPSRIRPVRDTWRWLRWWWRNC